MPQWTKKDERQYEHIKKIAADREKPLKAAKAIAARTVNKHRRSEGRTPNKTTQGTGNPNRSLDDRSVSELRNLASQLKIDGRSKMKKDQLVQAIQKVR